MKLVLVAALVVVVCYFATSVEYVGAQDAATPSPPPKNKMCGRGGKGRKGPPPANRTTRSLEDIKANIHAAGEAVGKVAAKAIKTAESVAEKGMQKAQSIAQGAKGRKPKGSTTTPAPA